MSQLPPALSATAQQVNDYGYVIAARMQLRTRHCAPDLAFVSRFSVRMQPRL
jgi:hypothetical protein